MFVFFFDFTIDISWDLIQRYPSLTITKDLSGKYPLNTLAESMKHEGLFLSQSRLNFWQRWIYDSIILHSLLFILYKILTPKKRTLYLFP